MGEIKAELKWIHSPDIQNIDHLHPDDPENFSFLLQVMFGPKGRIGEESFDVVVCSVEWVRKNTPLIGSHHIIVSEFDLELIKRTICEFAQQCSGATWSEVARKLSRLGKWEFENYNEK